MEPRDERLSNHSLHISAPDFSSLKQVPREEPDFPPTESPMSSPQSESVTKSPETMPESGSNRALSPSVEAEATPPPDVGQRRGIVSGSRSTGAEREKRKRSRVTPDQLVHLERFFNMDRSPTATRRREISELLGMQERQTQIWFQNRRAKAKLLNGKGKGRTDSAPPTASSDLLPGYDADLHRLIHENEPVTIIPCTDLTIGTWRRMASQISKHDLVAYICESRSSLIWFIHSSGYGFKMEIPFGIVVDTEFVSASPGSALASFFLSQPPLFYLEDIATDPTGGPPMRSWKRCADWTEGMQATKILRHDLVGSAVQLAYVLRNFQATPGSDIRLRCPPYVRQDLSSAHSMDHNSVALPPSLMGDPQGYRPPFGGSGLETGRDSLVAEASKQQRYNYPSIYVPLSAPSDTSTFGDNLGNSPRPHLSLPDSTSDSSPPNAFTTFPLSAASSSSSYSTVSLYPIEVPVQRPQSHLGNYAHVSTSGQSPYIGQGQGFSIPAPPASAPPSHSQFELAPTPPQSSFSQQQQFPSHQSAQMFKPPAMPVPLPFGNGFDTSGQHGE